ncbi:MAG: (4Fe-4S)-binding protein [Actinomycetia bacterium]|nr:(4Fe-4S)-binding protein [Actinomycetes bacterium]
MVRVRADRNVCIGAGLCVMTAAAMFDQDETGLVVLLNEQAPTSDEERVRAAVRVCPSGALRVIDASA